MASQNTSSSTWARAVDIFNKELTQDRKKRIDTAQQPVASFDDVLKLATSTERRWNDRKWRIGQTVVRDKIHSLLTQISTYAIFGDVLLQHHPNFAALAWGAFRSLLMVRYQIVAQIQTLRR
jgi:hypothetical protein